MKKFKATQFDGLQFFRENFSQYCLSHRVEISFGNLICISYAWNSAEIACISKITEHSTQLLWYLNACDERSRGLYLTRKCLLNHQVKGCH